MAIIERAGAAWLAGSLLACGGSVGPLAATDGGSAHDVATVALGDSAAYDSAPVDASLDSGEAPADGGAMRDSGGADGAEEAPACVPKTCAELGVPCLTAPDGCGGVLNCGSCPSGGSCSPSPEGPVCGSCLEVCKTCSQLGYECGLAGDGQGGLLYCGACAPPSTCGGGGMPGRCGLGDGGCAPTSCIAQGAYCGTVSDGCGNTLQCGSCPDGQICGGKRPGVCG